MLNYSRLAALFSILVGFATLMGWWLDIPFLTNPTGSPLPIALSTGICFVSCGVALAFLAFKRSNIALKHVACLISLLALAIGIAVGLHYLRLMPFDFDSIIMGKKLATTEWQFVAWRMAPNTVIGIVACSLALMLAYGRRKASLYPSQALAVGVIGLGIAVVCGYAYSTPLAYGLVSMTPMALPSGIVFMVLGFGIFFARPNVWLAGVVTDPGKGGKTARILLPIALLAPIVLDSMRLYGQKHLWFDTTTGTTIMVLLLSLGYSILILRHCHHLTRASRKEQIAQQALRASEERTRQIINEAYDAFVAIDRDGRITSWNLQAEKMFGYKYDDAIGKKLSDTIVPFEHHPHEGGIRRLVETGEGPILNKRIQTRAQRSNGETFPVELAIFPVQVEGTTTFCAFVQDITERKRIESEVEALNTQLVLARDQALQGSKLKSEFLANMSHEIRTPMNAVIGLSDLLKRTQLTKEQKRFVDLIVNSGNSLLQIIDDILIFSKIEAGRLDLDCVDFDLLAIVEGTADLLADKAREKKLSLTTFLEPEIRQYVRGDGQRLRQILLNLLSNAVKFTERGRILVRAALEATSEETVTISISVSDTGIGISEEGQKLLFNPFTQVDGSITRRHGGTGLGLTITKRLVELMGGTISVSSTEGKGSTFCLTIPFKQATREYERTMPAANLESIRALVVGLKETEATIVEMYGESWGMRCTLANYCEEALLTLGHASHEGDPFAVVLVDSQLQDGDPFDLARTIRQEPYSPACRLLLLLGIDDIGKNEKAVQAGYDATMTKPIKQSSLFNCLIAMLGPRMPAQQDAPPAPSLLRTPSTKFILVAEDNQVNQEVAVLQLEKLGYNAHVVANGKEAVAASDDPNCQLIFMDCQMPEMDGFEASRTIREREKESGKHIPIIAMTAHAMEGDRELCLAAGMDDYLAKPVRINKLREALQRYAGRNITQEFVSPAQPAPGDAIEAATMDNELETDGDEPENGEEGFADDFEPDGESLIRMTPEEALAVADSMVSDTSVVFKSYIASVNEISQAVRNEPSDTTSADVTKQASDSPALSFDVGAVPSAEVAPVELASAPAELTSGSASLICISAELTSDPANATIIPANLPSAPCDLTSASAKPTSASANQSSAIADGTALVTAGGVTTENYREANGYPSAVRDVTAVANDLIVGTDTVNDIVIGSFQDDDQIDASLLDFDKLQSVFGEESAKKFLNLFAQSTPSLLSRLETSITGRQLKPAKAAAHELKGMCATINIARMYELCKAIEKSTDNLDWSEAESLLAHLKITFYKAEAAIKKL